MTTIVFYYPNGAVKILKSKSKEVKSFIKDMVHDFGAERAIIK